MSIDTPLSRTRPAPGDAAAPAVVAEPGRSGTSRLGRDRTAGGPSRSYFPALDGLRALAAFAVLAYHAGVPWLRGGLLGVDVFFVLSGFLITFLLLGEQARTATIGLADFWRRRARRLLPAIVVVGAAVLAYAQFVGSTEQRPQTRLDLAATLSYVANWRFAFSHQSYFDAFNDPSPLLHTWSLGVEEQFYLLWPLVLLLLVRLLRRRSPVAVAGGVLIVSSIGTMLSAATAYLLARGGTDASRIYYGTDTRSQALLVGAALAAWYFLRAQRGLDRARRGRRLDPGAGRRRFAVLGVLGLAGVGVFWAVVPGESALLDRGGFLLVAVSSGALIASLVVSPTSPVARLLSVAPLRYLGRISYGLYLWHWPVFLTLTHARTGLAGPELVVVRFAVSIAFAAVTFALLELPIRRLPRRTWHLRLAVPVALAAVIGLVVTASVRPPELNQFAALDKQVAAARYAPSLQTEPAAEAKLGAPIRAMVVGDSVAITVGAGLTLLQSQYGIKIINHGWTGCGVARKSLANDGGKTYPAFADCAQWPTRYAQWVDQDRPDVALLVVGRWEVVDRFVDGHWTNINDPAFRRYLAGELDTAITTLSARGAKVVLTTAPIFHAHELPDGSSSPVNDPHRVALFNELVRAAVARHSTVAQVFDMEAVLTPGGVYQQRMNGKDIRFDDGIHIATYGTSLVAKTLVPAMQLLGDASRADLAAKKTPGNTPVQAAGSGHS